MAADKITIKVFSGPNRSLVDRTCFMSYGLLNVLVRIVGDINRIAAVDLDPDVSAEVLEEVLATRNANGQKAEGQETPDLPADQAELIFDFVKESVLSFFVRRLSKTADLINGRKDELTAISSFMTGSVDLPSNEASSGPSV